MPINWRPISANWRRLYSAVDWRQQAPRWSAVLIASLIAADLAHLIVSLRQPVIPPALAPTTNATLAAHRRPHSANAAAWRIAHAHLFGSDKVASRAAAGGNAPDTQLALALTGVIATPNPNLGFAILGERGKAAHMYRTGAFLGDGLSGRLYQTFADHVVLELNGHLETLKLPHQSALAVKVAAAPGSGDTKVAQESDTGDSAEVPANPAQQWFEGMLHPQRQIVGGQTVGLKLRPDVRVQREYDLKINDLLTAVNGVDIAGANSPDDLQEALKSAGKSLSLTVTRAGVQQMVTVAVSD